MNKYELLYVNGTKVKAKLYDNRTNFVNDFQKIEKSGKPCMAQGISKDGSIAKVFRNGLSDDDIVMTAVVNFGNGKKYSYIANKHYSGLYEVSGRYQNSIVSVTYEWRQIDDFRAELWEKGYDNPTAFESILIRKVAK